MKNKLEDGVLGKVYQISTRRVGPYSGRIRDVGVVKDLASHDIDLVGFLSGASYEDLSSRTLKPLGNSYEDLLLAIGTLSDGSLVSHLVNWVSPTKERVTSVLGEKGMLVADTLSVDLYFYENGSKPTNWDGISMFKGTSEGATHKFELVKNEPLVNEHVAFQNAVIENSSKGLATLAEGLKVLKVAERIVQS
jgi:predicted dehydrogenase